MSCFSDGQKIFLNLRGLSTKLPFRQEMLEISSQELKVHPGIMVGPFISSQDL
jgi:hypothetical protein